MKVYSTQRKESFRKMYHKRKAHFDKMKRPLFISERPPESKKITMNSNLIQFLCKEANQAQIEAVLFEIDPHQLSALREVISNTIKRDKYTIDKYIDDRLSEKTNSNRLGKKKKTSVAVTKKAIQKSKSFVDKLLSEKATRMMLKKNARLIKSVLNRGYKHYENRLGVISVSTSNKTTKKSESLKNGQRNEQNPREETCENEQASKFEEEDNNEELSEDQTENVESEENYTDGEEGDDENDEIESEQEYEDFGSESGRYETDNV